MYKFFFKRLFDLIISLSAIPFVVLLILIFGPIIFFTDKGAIFYNAYRAGKDYKPFIMYKFRSMYVNSKDIRNSDGSTFNSAKDSRMTPIGCFLRKNSLDEFPQFINILLGSEESKIFNAYDKYICMPGNRFENKLYGEGDAGEKIREAIINY